MSITGGLVSVEDGHKNGGPQDYVPTRKIRVELSFDSEASLEPACALANEKVDELLGRTASPSRQTVIKTEPAKDDVATAEKVVKPIKDKPAVDVLAMEEPVSPTTIATVTGTPPVTELTAADVYKQVTRTQEQIKSAPKIVALIRKHTADLPIEKQIVSGIPADRRQAFLDDLELLRTS